MKPTRRDLLISFAALALPVSAYAQRKLLPGAFDTTLGLPYFTENNYFPDSIFKNPIPNNAQYNLENRIGSLSPNLEAWSEPIIRMEKNPPLVTVRVRNNNTTRRWPIPLNVWPSDEADRHLGVISIPDGKVYEFLNLSWMPNGEILCGGRHDFPLYGNAVSNPVSDRVNAAGWSTMAGMVIREDLLHRDGNLKNDFRINHALSILLDFSLVTRNTFIPPAVGGEALGTNPNGVPIGAKLAFNPQLNVDALNVHPLTREMARAARDYGLYLIDTNGSPPLNGKYTASVRTEVGLLLKAFRVPNDVLKDQIRAEMNEIIGTNGIYRVNL